MSDHIKIDWTVADLRAHIAALEAQLAEISSNATKARQAVERLANTKMDLSLSEWSELSSAILSALEAAPPAPSEDGSMTPEEIRLENLKQMAAYSGPIVSFEVREPYYLASCDHCGWVGSSELCGTDSYGDDSDVYCPRCHASGADSGKVASRIANPPAPKVTEEMVDAFIDRYELGCSHRYDRNSIRAALTAAQEAGKP